MEMIKSIQTQFNKVIEYSQSIFNPKTDSLFEKWYENKQWFIKKFNQNLIYEVPGKICFNLTDEQKIKKVEDLIYTIERRYKLYDLSDFIHQNKKSFFENVVTVSNDEIRIPLGMKITRAFKFFVDDKEILNDVQSCASRVLQEDKIEGTLCFSVHPLDYLSSSETVYGWRSCHSLDGDYRAGNLSYMGDRATILCYLKGDGDKILPNFPDNVPWNSKKWRMLLHFSDNKDMIFAGRQYPFTTTNALDVVWEHLIPILNTGYSDEQCRRFHHEPHL